MPLNAQHVYTGNLLTLLNWYGLLGGLVTLSLFTLHGAIFLGLRTTGELRQRASRAATGTALAAVPLAAIFLAVTQVSHGKPATDVTAAVAAVALIGGAAAALRGREGWAFVGTALTLVLAVATLFGDLWPNVLPSSTSAAYSLTVNNASSAHYTLVVMSWVALIFTPVVLVYQGWTYWVFRKRLSRSDIIARPGTRLRPSPGRNRWSPSAGGREAARPAAAALLGRGPRLPRGHRRPRPGRHRPDPDPGQPAGPPPGRRGDRHRRRRAGRLARRARSPCCWPAPRPATAARPPRCAPRPR